MTRRSLFAWRSTCLLRTCLVGALVLAQPAFGATADEKAAAEALFDEGVTLLRAGNLDAACAKLESSQRIDPGVGTLLYLGDCYEKSGRTASAWATFREAASVANSRGDDRAPLAAERAARLTPRLAKLTLLFETSSDAEIEGLEVLRDQSVVPRALWGTSVPVDPGEHVVSARAPGYASVQVRITVEGDAAVATLTIPRLTKSKVASSTASLPVPTQTPEPVSNGRGEGQRAFGVGVGVVGLLGVGAGAVFGVLAMTENDRAVNEFGCGPTSCPTPDGSETTNRALLFATASDIAFIAGGVLAITGVTLYFTAPRAETSARLTPSVWPGGAALNFQGQF